MDIDRNSRRRLRVQNWIFVVLFLVAIGLVGWLSTRYHLQADWTASGRHTLSEASKQLLEGMEGPVTITAFARESGASQLRPRIREMIERYRRHKADLSLAFVDPDQHPDRVRALGVRVDGELVVEYQGRRENLTTVGEQALTNALQRLARGGERRVLFLSGHGERSPGGERNFDYGQWTAQLQQKGIRFDTINLSITPAIPEDAAALVIADPRQKPLPGEAALIENWVAAGGNLLWLREPDGASGFEALAERLGVTLGDGTLVDPTGQQLGIDHPAFVVVAEYPDHPITGDLSSLTLFPIAGYLVTGQSDFRFQPILQTLERSWAETGELEGAIEHDKGELSGRLPLGVTATRNLADKNGAESTQRVAVVGDADFLSNQYLGNGANRELGNRLVNWLNHDDAFISIPSRTAPDVSLTLTPMISAVLGFGFLLVLPLGLAGTGVFIWWRRRKR
ncbi:GldG family protein [Thiohalomonas denitrificans]|uniref:ABC-type uncharacterized transport system involved in gliding motility, auxiliary component n=1 Tax=Thiohalomonas denitrificans TaxID=415747 RepID=A0A1G5PUX7_9GAMM|nr:GldG family protein [Thiohalomonas denitrificans]SCZ53232.1 ABC-type uncharacterized transport system involved in gliding motility, auxiliary component [Thiohalomonas denitrificans]